MFCTQTTSVPAAACRSCPELTLLSPTPRDQALVARRHQGGHLVIEACVDAAVTGQAEVDRRKLAHPQAAEVLHDARAQLARLAGRAVGGADRDLADDGQLLRVRVESLADQVVDRPVVLGRVDVIDTGCDRGPEDTDPCGPVGRPGRGERAIELHGAVPGSPHAPPAKRER